jgi:hypothetical protein
MPRAATSYRFGGDACSPEALQAEARAAFLDVADELYPAVLDELLSIPEAPWFAGVPSRAIRAWLEGWADPPAGWDALLQAVEAWAHRWRLTDQGRPPEWVEQVALRTLSTYRRWEFRTWDVPIGGRLIPTQSDPVILPPVPAPPRLPDGLQRVLTFEARDGRRYVSCRFYPEFQGAGRVKRTLREYSGWVLRLWGTSAEKACRRIDEVVAEALAAGAAGGQWHADRRIVYWAARALIGREAYEDIARTANRGVSELPEFVSPPTVRNQVGEFLVLIGLRRRTGRKDR